MPRGAEPDPFPRPLCSRGGTACNGTQRINPRFTQVREVLDEPSCPAKPPFPSSNLGGTPKTQSVAAAPRPALPTNPLSRPLCYVLEVASARHDDELDHLGVRGPTLARVHVRVHRRRAV